MLNPKKHLEYYSRIYPNAWKLVDQMRADRGKELPFWPDWCFLPLAGAYAIVHATARAQGIDIASEKGLALINDVGIMGALAAWRTTQGVYRFDPDVYGAVIDTPLTGNVPHDVLFNLPEWCIYVETPDMNFCDVPLAGFFAYLEYDVTDGHKELRLVLDHTMPEHEIPLLRSQVIHLGPWSLLESVESVVQEAGAVAKEYGVESPELTTGTVKIIADSYMPLVSLLLYICSVNGEIGDGQRYPARPKPIKTKKGPRIFPPAKVTTWDVGVRMGAALRKAREMPIRANNHGAIDAGAEEKHRASPRPHVRRAHWHGYWTGPRDGNQKFVLRWVSPVLVGAGDAGDVPLTIRPVK